MPRTVYAFPTVNDVSASLRDFVLRAQDEALAKHDRFTIALSGGSLPATLARGLLEHQTAFQWSKWHVFYADERCVPLNDAESNHRLAHEAFLAHVPIPAEQVYTINPDLVGQPEAAAEDYQHQLMQAFAPTGDDVRFPVFDLILLGMGPDGHTCSLFPGHPLVNERTLWVSSLTDSPKPPPSRITLTFPVLNHAHAVAFVTTGANKQDMLVRVLDQTEEGLPAGMVNPTAGHVYWFLDEPAAAKLQDSLIDRPAAL
ncbi:suppressor of los1-1 [Tieghemiomyces parasiticus]|uniref:6-phosphogluconolactonase n=1 Tax=Tieghemiomyces parasiticus TaxID=78921 RepID=A0A9W8AA30_9FUNG|nr:suppressor of los1-1 [Tieghemiomyces parasiticus]